MVVVVVVVVLVVEIVVVVGVVGVVSSPEKISSCFIKTMLTELSTLHNPKRDIPKDSFIKITK